MRITLREFRSGIRQPWQLAFLLLAIIPLFPEYISFPLTIGAAVFAFMDIRERKAPIKIGTIGWLLAVYIGYMGFTAFFTANLASTLETFGMWAFFLIAYLVVNNLLTDKERFHTLALLITAVAGLVGLIACLQYRIGCFTHLNTIRFWDWLDHLFYSTFNIQVGTTTYYLRACSTFSNPNVLSEYLMVVMPVVVYFNFYEQRNETHLFCRACLFLAFGGVIFSFCRGGYIAILLMALALILLNVRHRFTTVTLYLFSSLLLIPDEVVERFLTILPGISTSNAIIENASNSTSLITTADIINNSAADLAISDRWLIWLDSLNSIGQRPLFGFGAGTRTTWAILQEHGLNAIHSHNIALQLMMEGGIIALVIMLLIGFRVVKNGIDIARRGFNTESFWVGMILLGSTACFLIQGMVDYPLLTPKLVLNFVMMLGIADRAVKLYESEPIHIKAYFARKLADKKSLRQI